MAGGGAMSESIADRTQKIRAVIVDEGHFPRGRVADVAALVHSAIILGDEGLGPQLAAAGVNVEQAPGDCEPRIEQAVALAAADSRVVIIVPSPRRAESWLRRALQAVADQVQQEEEAAAAGLVGRGGASDPVLDPPWVALMVMREDAVAGDEVVGVSVGRAVTGFAALTAVGLAARWRCGVRMLVGQEPISEVKNPEALAIAQELATAVAVPIELEQCESPVDAAIETAPRSRAVLVGLSEVTGKNPYFGGGDKVARRGVEQGEAGVVLKLLEEAAQDVLVVLDGLHVEHAPDKTGLILGRVAAVLLGTTVMAGVGAGAAAAADLGTAGLSAAGGGGGGAGSVAAVTVTPSAPSSPIGGDLPSASSTSQVPVSGSFWFDGVLQMDDPAIDAYPIAWTNPSGAETSVSGIPESIFTVSDPAQTPELAPDVVPSVTSDVVEAVLPDQGVVVDSVPAATVDSVPTGGGGPAQPKVVPDAGAPVAGQGGFVFEGGISIQDPGTPYVPQPWSNPGAPSTDAIPDAVGVPAQAPTPQAPVAEQAPAPEQAPVAQPGPAQPQTAPVEAAAPQVVAASTVGPAAPEPAATQTVEPADLPVSTVVAGSDESVPATSDAPAQAAPEAAAVEVTAPVQEAAAAVPEADVVDVTAEAVSTAADTIAAPAAAVDSSPSTAQPGPDRLAQTGDGTTAAVGAAGAALLAAGAGLVAATRKRDDEESDGEGDPAEA